jgi:hypothetical protein
MVQTAADAWDAAEDVGLPGRRQAAATATTDAA